MAEIIVGGIDDETALKLKALIKEQGWASDVKLDAQPVEEENEEEEEETDDDDEFEVTVDIRRADRYCYDNPFYNVDDIYVHFFTDIGDCDTNHPWNEHPRENDTANSFPIFQRANQEDDRIQLSLSPFHGQTFVDRVGYIYTTETDVDSDDLAKTLRMVQHWINGDVWEIEWEGSDEGHEGPFLGTSWEDIRDKVFEALPEDVLNNVDWLLAWENRTK